MTLVARTAAAAARGADARATGVALPRERLRRTPAEYAARYGATDAELEPLVAFAGAQRLRVEKVDRVAGCVVARGSVAALAAAFRVEPVHHVGASGLHRTHEGPVHLPATLASHVHAVLGLDELPVAEPHVAHVHADARHASPAEVARHYAFPAGTGRGRRIAIIELGGGFHETDLDLCAARHRHARPAVGAHGVDGATCLPADPQAIAQLFSAMGMPARPVSVGRPAGDAARGGRDTPAGVMWTIETTMDLELIAALVPEAQIDVWFAPNTAQGKYLALAAAIATAPDVVSISWGGPEADRTVPHVEALEALFEQAALLDVSICCSSGDKGLLEYPASSPYVLGCGGTRLHGPDGRVAEERVWNEAVPNVPGRRFCSAGGVSRIFAEPPDWQRSAEVQRKTGERGRGVPDVAAKADVVSGYDTIVGGLDVALGGTSAAAPLWAALIARVNERLAPRGARAGYLTPLLYGDGPFAGRLRGVCEGASGTWQACEGWNPCTGLGSPDGGQLLEAFERAASPASRAEPARGE